MRRQAGFGQQDDRGPAGAGPAVAGHLGPERGDVLMGRRGLLDDPEELGRAAVDGADCRACRPSMAAASGTASIAATDSRSSIGIGSTSPAMA